MIFMMFFLSSMFMFLKHPLSLGLTLLLQTILVALISGLLNSSFWFSYIIFLILVGGLMILFIYMTSVASNEKFKFSFKMSWIFIVSITFLIILENSPENNCSNFILTLNKYFNSNTYLTFLFMIFYLLFSLIVVMSLSKHQGPLRKLT
uniref:NADH-ubiquinone oxidoreductase chain 6 n=1 Tax=Chirotenon longimanus TaxID=1205658 RepID=A0A0S2MRT2_9CUCU|nr:NADH deshydrogenase subunit 6 [Chirotenon longimanus]